MALRSVQESGVGTALRAGLRGRLFVVAVAATAWAAVVASPTTAVAAPPVPTTPAPEASPAGPEITTPSDEIAPTTTTIAAGSTAPGTAVTGTSTTSPATPASNGTGTTAVVVGDVATAAPPIVPQFASQGISRGGAPSAAGSVGSSLASAGPVLPTTGASSTSIALGAAVSILAGIAARVLGRRRHAV